MSPVLTSGLSHSSVRPSILPSVPLRPRALVLSFHCCNGVVAGRRISGRTFSVRELLISRTGQIRVDSCCQCTSICDFVRVRELFAQSQIGLLCILLVPCCVTCHPWRASVPVTCSTLHCSTAAFHFCRQNPSDSQVVRFDVRSERESLGGIPPGSPQIPAPLLTLG